MQQQTLGPGSAYPRLTPALKHLGPLGQSPWDPAPLTSGLTFWDTPDPTGNHVMKRLCAPVGRHLIQDLQPHEHPPWIPGLPTSGPALGPGPPKLYPAHDPALPTSYQQPLHKAGLGRPIRLRWGLGGQPHLPDTGVSLPQQKDHTVHTGGTPRAYSSDDERGVYHLDTKGISYQRPLLHGQGT